MSEPTKPGYYYCYGREGSTFGAGGPFDLDNPPPGLEGAAEILRARTQIHDLGWTEDDGTTVVIRRKEQL